MAKIVTRGEVRRRRMKFEIFAGMADFLAILAGIVVIAVCVVLLVSLVKWVMKDGSEMFATIWDMFTSALIVPE